MVLNRTSLDHYSFAEGAERVVIAPIVSKSIIYSIVAHYIVSWPIIVKFGILPLNEHLPTICGRIQED